jgi:hypothetical protein
VGTLVDGVWVGKRVGRGVGDREGTKEGMGVGEEVGAFVGIKVVAVSDGFLEGDLEDSFVGFIDGNGPSEGMGVEGLGVMVEDDG